jgi:hypothetical protein
VARYRKIDPKIWNDRKFRELSDSSKLAFFLLLTHPSMTAVGAMRATIAGLAAEMKWTEEAFREAFAEISGKGMAEHDPKASFMALPNFLSYNAPESPNVVKGWTSAIDLIPECSLRDVHFQRVKAFIKGLPESFQEVLPEAFRKSMPNQEQEQEQEQEQDKSLLPPANAGGVDFDGQTNGHDLLGESPPRNPPVPYGKILGLYHEILCPPLPRVVALTDKRKKHIKARWEGQLPTLEDWRTLLQAVKTSKFLMGQAQGTNGRAPFQADLDFIINESNVTKIAEGKYHR